MKSQYLGNLTANTKTMVFEKIGKYEGYNISLSTTAAAGTINISVYESNGGDAQANDGDEKPLATDAQYWVQVATSGTASATEGFALNREKFRGKFVYMDIGISAGSLDDVIVHFNQN